MAKLSVKGFALAGGITCGIYILFIGWAAWLFNWGTTIVDALAPFYIGLSATFLGGIIGGVWAFLDGLVGGALFAWLHNYFVKK